MVNPPNNATKALDQAISTGATSASRRAASQVHGNAPQQDTAELSSVSQDLAVYMQALKNLPDSRSEVVQAARQLVSSSIKYPPLDVIAGFGKLVGTPSDNPKA